MIIGDMEIRLRADIARLQRDMDDARRVVGDATAAMGRAADMAKAALTSIAGAVGLAKIAEMSDEYSKLTAQLRLATDGTRAYAQAYADVKRIANSSQTDLAATGSLYASLSRATKDLHTSQQSVADITEAVNLSLKISGAGAQESSGAILQLSQAFAAGALRGDEFNSVTEAAPRLMKAIADGIGVPVGALRTMAEQGKLTADLVAKTLPQALERLRTEAGQIQTISGAFTVLKNNVLEFVGTEAQASGAVAVLTGGIGLLANNLGLLVDAAIVGGIVKLGASIGAWTTKTYEAVTAAVAARAATIASMQANVADTAAKAAQLAATRAMIGVAREEAVAKLASSNASVAAAQTAIAAAEAAGVQSFALRTVRLATAELSVAEAQRSAMLAELAVLGRQQAAVSAQLTEALAAQATAQAALNGATGAGGVAAGVASRAVGLLGGPIGIIITVLGLAATAWTMWGHSAETSNKQAAESYEEAHKRIVKGLDEQIEKNEKLIKYQNMGFSKTEVNRNQSALDQLAAASKRLDDINNQTGDYAPGKGKDSADILIDRANVMKNIIELTAKMKANDEAAAKAAAGDSEALLAVRQRLLGVNQQYLDDLQKLQGALDKGSISQGDYVAAVSKLAKDTYEGSTAGKVYAQSLDAQAEAIQRAAEAQGLRNQRDQQHIQFLKASGQTDEASTIRAAADAQVKDLNDQIAAQRRLMGVEAQRQTSAEQLAQKQAEIAGKIGNLRVQIDSAQAKRDEDLLLLEQQKYRQAVNNTADLIEAAQAETKAQQDRTRDMGDEIEAIGLTSKQIAELTAARLRDQAAALDRRAEISMIDDVTDALRRQADELRKQAGLTITKEALTQQKELWGRIENTAHDTFISIFDSGKSAFDRLRDTLKNGLLELLYQMTVKQWIFNIGASVGMTGTGAAAQAAGLTGGSGATGVGSLIGAAQTASNMYKVLNGSVGASLGTGVSALGSFVGSSSISAFGAGMGMNGSQAAAAQAAYANAGMQGTSSAIGYGQMAGTAASYGAGVLGGHYVGNAIAGDYSVAHGQTVTNVASVIGAVIGGPIGGVIGGTVGGLINRAFGMGSKEVQTTGISGTLSSTGTNAESYAKWHQNGGWFRSDKSGTDSTAFSADTVAALTNGLNQLKAVSSSFAASLGVDATSIQGYSKTFNIDLGKDGNLSDGITKLLGTVGDELATKLVPNVLQFAKTGETASATLERLAGDFDATTQMAQLLGKTAAQAFGTAGIASAAARERLVQLAGSTSNLTSMAASYAQNYLTEGQRLAPVRKAVDEAMAGLGLASVTTREQFKQVIDSLDLTSEAGARQYVSMMQLSDAFAQVHATSTALAKTEAQIADERKDLQDQLDKLTMTSAQQLAKQRDALDDSNKALFDQVQAAQKVKDAQDAAKASLGDFIGQMKSFATTAKSLNSSLVLGDLSTLTPEQQYAEARRQFEQTRQQAAAGDAAAQGNLQSIEQTFLQLSQKLNGGDAQYSSDLAAVMHANDDLSKWAAQQVDVAQASLNALTSSSASLTDINATLTVIAQGGQLLPAATAAQGVTGYAPAPAAIDYSAMGTGNMTALVDEIKSLRGQVADLLTEAKGRRADAQVQTGDVLKTVATSADNAADKVVAGKSQADTDIEWKLKAAVRKIV